MEEYLTRLKDLFIRLEFFSTLKIIENLTVYRDYYELDFWSIFPFDIKLLEMELYRIKLFLKEHIINETNFEVKVEMKYNENKAILQILKGKTMQQKIFNFIIPYGEREEYIEFIQEVNNIVKEDGIVQLFVNNNPYELGSILYVEAKNEEDIKFIAKKFSVLYLENPKNYSIFFEEMKNRNWNTAIFPLECSVNDIKSIINNLYYFASKKDIESKGYVNSTLEKNKVFISYSHKDKDKVQVIEDKLRESGVSFWLDKYEIEFGKSLNEEISKAMEQSNVFILCLSENCVDGNYIRHEIDTIINNVFIKKDKTNKIAIPIKLDNVKLNNIIMGLENYKYCNYENEEEFNQMISMIKKKIS